MTIITVARLFLASILVWAGATKLHRPARAARFIDGGSAEVRVLAAVEVALSIGLITPVSAVRFLATAAATVFFAATVAVSWKRRTSTADCGCMGDTLSVSGIRLVVRNSAFAALATTALAGEALTAGGPRVSVAVAIGSVAAAWIAVLALAQSRRPDRRVTSPPKDRGVAPSSASRRVFLARSGAVLAGAAVPLLAANAGVAASTDVLRRLTTGEGTTGERGRRAIDKLIDQARQDEMVAWPTSWLAAERLKLVWREARVFYRARTGDEGMPRRMVVVPTTGHSVLMWMPSHLLFEDSVAMVFSVERGEILAFSHELQASKGVPSVIEMRAELVAFGKKYTARQIIAHHPGLHSGSTTPQSTPPVDVGTLTGEAVKWCKLVKCGIGCGGGGGGCGACCWYQPEACQECCSLGAHICLVSCE